jgi:hypothetical protein
MHTYKKSVLVLLGSLAGLTIYAAASDTKQHTVVITGSSLTIEDVVNVARNRYTVVLADDAVKT